MKDSLGDRMKKNYEDRTRYLLPRRTYTIIRVDGKAFHTLTRGCERPFDKDLVEHMDRTAEYLCENIMGAKCAYVQSDEISILVTDFATDNTDAWFNGNLQKIASVSASMATAIFNFEVISAGNEKIKTFAMFDSRVFTVSDKVEVENYFIWRQKDATRNSVQMVGQSLYSHKELQGVSTNQLQEMIFAKGINWNEYDAGFKRGRMVVKGECGFKIEAPPIFTQDKDYLNALVPVMRPEDL